VENVVHSSVNFGAINFLNGVQNVVVRNNVFVGGFRNAITYWASPSTAATNDYGLSPQKNNLFINNTIYNTDKAIDGGESYLVRFSDDPQRLVFHSWDPNDSSPSLHIRPSIPNGYIYKRKMGSCTTGDSEPVWGTEIRGLTSDGSCYWYCYEDPIGSSTNNVFRNNIFATNSARLFQADNKRYRDGGPDTPTFENNLFYQMDGVDDGFVPGTSSAGWEASCTSWNNNLYANPLFNYVDNLHLNPRLRDLRTSSSSPAKGSGSTVDMPLTDMKGLVRDGADIGAYEITADDGLPNYTTILLKNNGPTNKKFDVLFISQGYTKAQLSDAISDIDDQYNALVGHNGIDAFVANEKYFNVHRIIVEAPVAGVRLDCADFLQIVGTVDYDAMFPIKNYINYGPGGDNKEYANCVPSSWYNFVWEIQELDKASQPYLVSHELAHYLCYQDMTRDPVAILDEYFDQGNPCGDKSWYAFNSTGRPSNDKWSDLVATPPVLGSNNCDEADNVLWRPQATCLMNDASSEVELCPVCAKAVELCIKRHPDVGEYANTNPIITISGVVEDGTYSGSVVITATCTSVPGETGIEKAEFYFGPVKPGNRYYNWGAYLKVEKAIDRSSPYSWVLDTTAYPNGVYELQVVAYDKYWNTTRKIVQFSIEN
jgi:hypothetical protein